MKEPVWVLEETVRALHEVLLREFGGLAGIRDEGLLKSALARPVNQFRHRRTTLPELAAAYAFGLVRDHPFIDGNKRTGFTVAVLFLESNGYIFRATEADAAIQTLGLAASMVSESAYAIWLKENSHRPSRARAIHRRRNPNK